MNQILALREKRANLWNETKAFLDSHRSEDGMVSAEDNATYEKMEADVVALGKEIDRQDCFLGHDPESGRHSGCDERPAGWHRLRRRLSRTG